MNKYMYLFYAYICMFMYVRVRIFFLCSLYIPWAPSLGSPLESLQAPSPKPAAGSSATAPEKEAAAWASRAAPHVMDVTQ